jgi:hypothetical protein
MIELLFIDCARVATPKPAPAGLAYFRLEKPTAGKTGDESGSEPDHETGSQARLHTEYPGSTVKSRETRPEDATGVRDPLAGNAD